MKRRRFVQALVGTPAASALFGQQPGANQSAPGVPLNPTQGVPPPARAADELPSLTASVSDAAADYAPQFFSVSQYSALSRLSVALMPAALDANAPQFLDFLLSQSLPDRQRVYREGLDALNTQSRGKFNKPFADLDDSQVGAMLTSLRQPWTYTEPADPAARFLRAAKVDVRTATTNAPQAASATLASPAPAARRFNGSGQYWYPLD
jgi:Gluconate 2-dehydrogenase subunit 3